MSQQTSPSQSPTEHPFGPKQPRWRVWLIRAVVFTITFSVLMFGLSALGTIVEKFFFMLYTE